MKKIEVYPKKAIGIYFLVIFSVLFIFSLCNAVSMIGKALKGGNIDDGLPILILFCCAAPFIIMRVFPLSPSVTADENGIIYRFYRGVVTISWNNIKRIYLTENDVVQIEVLNLDEYLKNLDSMRCTEARLHIKMGGEAVQIPLFGLEVDVLKFTNELQNMLEEYKNAN